MSEKQLFNFWMNLSLAFSEYKLAAHEERLMLYNLHRPFWKNTARQKLVRDHLIETLEHLTYMIEDFPQLLKLIKKE